MIIRASQEIGLVVTVLAVEVITVEEITIMGIGIVGIGALVMIDLEVIVVKLMGIDPMIVVIGMIGQIEVVLGLDPIVLTGIGDPTVQIILIGILIKPIGKIIQIDVVIVITVEIATMMGRSRSLWIWPVRKTSYPRSRSAIGCGGNSKAENTYSNSK
jgi:hypothetical protein